MKIRTNRRLTRRQKEALNMRPITSRYAMKLRDRRIQEIFVVA